MEPTTKIPVMIYTESTPNPNTLKFVTNKALLLNDAVEFQSIEETHEAPLAKALFEFDGVTNVPGFTYPLGWSIENHNNDGMCWDIIANNGGYINSYSAPNAMHVAFNYNPKDTDNT